MWVWVWVWVHLNVSIYLSIWTDGWCFLHRNELTNWLGFVRCVFVCWAAEKRDGREDPIWDWEWGWELFPVPSSAIPHQVLLHPLRSRKVSPFSSHSALPFPSLQLLSRNLTCVQFVLFLPGFMRLSRTSYLVGDHLVTLSLSRNIWACLPFGTNCCKLCLFVCFERWCLVHLFWFMWSPGLCLTKLASVVWSKPSSNYNLFINVAQV